MKNKKGLSTLIIVLVAIIVLGIGYAVIENITLTINGSATATANDANFKVIFEGATSNSASNQNITVTNSIAEDEQGTPEKQQKLHAVFSVSGMTKAGDYADVTYTVKNKSEDMNDLDDIRARGGFVHRKELDNQFQFKGYVGPMWNGTKDGKGVIRYETPEVNDMLSR